MKARKITEFILKIFGIKPAIKDLSEFSRFFREASSREKKRVFMDVARKASADQREVIRRAQVTKA